MILVDEGSLILSVITKGEKNPKNKNMKKIL